MADIHDRMPVILSAESYGMRLDPEIDDPRAFESLLAPYPADDMAAVPVSTVMNDPRNDPPKCIGPVNAE